MELSDIGGWRVMKRRELFWEKASDRLAKLGGRGLDIRMGAVKHSVLADDLDIFVVLGPIRGNEARFQISEGHAATGPA